MPPPKVSGPPKPASSMRTSEHVGRSFGRRRPGDDRPVARPTRSIVRPAAPPNGSVRDRQHGAVGVELAGRLRQRVLQAPDALLVHLDDRLGRRGQGALGGQAVLLVDHRDDGGGARLELVAHTRLEAAVDLVLGEPADHAAGGGADGDRAEHRRRRQADEHADAAAPAGALAAQVAAGVGDVDLAGLVARDEDHPVGLDLLLLDEPNELVEVLLGRLERRVAGQDQIECVAHGPSLALRLWSSDRASRICRMLSFRESARPGGG